MDNDRLLQEPLLLSQMNEDSKPLMTEEMPKKSLFDEE